MTYKRKNFNVTLKEADKEYLEKLAMRRKLPQTEVAGYLFEWEYKHDIAFRTDWQDKVNEIDASLKQNRYALMDPDDPLYCVARGWIDDHFECTWGREGMPPRITKIAKTIEGVNVRCANCKKSLDITSRLITAEAKLAKGIVVPLASCAKGGRLLADGKKIMCLDPKKSAMPRDVNKFCKTIRGGANCEYLTWAKIEIKGKQFGLDDKSV